MAGSLIPPSYVVPFPHLREPALPPRDIRISSGLHKQTGLGHHVVTEKNAIVREEEELIKREGRKEYDATLSLNRGKTQCCGNSYWGKK